MRQQVVTTSGVQNSGAIVLDRYGSPFISIQVVPNGAATFTVQQTLDDVTNPAITPTWFPSSVAALVGASANIQGAYNFPVAALRLSQTAGAGGATMTVLQAGGASV